MHGQSRKSGIRFKRTKKNSEIKTKWNVNAMCGCLFHSLLQEGCGLEAYRSICLILNVEHMHFGIIELCRGNPFTVS